jgi:hypothetical protein
MMLIVLLLLLMLLMSLVTQIFSECCDESVIIIQYHCHLLIEMNYFVSINALYLGISVDFFVS